MKPLREFVASNNRFVVAHRGSSGTAPENTLAAFREAVNAGARMIETDIQFTRDGHIITFHDRVLNRTTEGAGYIKDLDLDEVKQYDAGTWFSPEFAGEQIPSLREVLDLVNGKAYLNLEIKDIRNGDVEPRIRKLLEVIDRYGYMDKILFSSFYHDFLKIIKQIEPMIPTAAIKIPGDSRLPSELNASLGCEAFVCSIAEINREIAEDAEKRNMFVGVYSVDTQEQLNTILQYDVKALVTNNPAWIVKELESLKIEIV